MIRRILLSMSLCALLVAPSAAQDLTAVPPYRSSSGPYSSGRPGIFLTSLQYPGVYGSYIQGITPYDARAATNLSPDLVPASGGPGIFMTSLQYPGIYGSYAQGITPYKATMSTDLRSYVPTDHLPLAPEAPRGLTGRRPEQAIAYLDIRVPLDATLWVQGVRMTQSGTLRRFVSPPLRDDQDYTYTIKASWDENGQDVVENRQVKVHPGDRLEVDLRRATSEGGSSILRTRPLPIPPLR
jgi:uncharacterized protein (TIGR03000 family)